MNRTRWLPHTNLPRDICRSRRSQWGWWYWPRFGQPCTYFTVTQDRSNPRRMLRRSLRNRLLHLQPLNPRQHQPKFHVPCCIRKFPLSRAVHANRFTDISRSRFVWPLIAQARSSARRWKSPGQASTSPAWRAKPPENGGSLRQTIRTPESGYCASSSVATALRHARPPRGRRRVRRMANRSAAPRRWRILQSSIVCAAVDAAETLA